MLNLNAALGCAQLERVTTHLDFKHVLAQRYIALFEVFDLQPIVVPEYCRPNYWLNAVICDDPGSA